MAAEATSHTTGRGKGRPPLDPRLLRYSGAARGYVVLTVGFAVATVVAIIVAAGMTAAILAELVTDPAARSVDAQALHLTVLAAALVARAALTFGHDRYAQRASARAISELRARALDVLTDPRRTSPRRLVEQRDHAATVLLRGLDALRPYLSGYVPALVISVIVTPVVIVSIAFIDWPSAAIVVVTLPLIPLFMVLVGLMTRDRTQRKLETMSRLSSQLLDLISGLPTLRALHRAQGPAARVAALGNAHRRSTMSTLRVAFLSGAVLELLATLSVALVAVGIGLRLVYGEMSLFAGVFALILAPEAYFPLRRVGAQFHNSEDGITASQEAFALIEAGEQESPLVVASRGVSLPGAEITLVDVGVHGRDGWAPAGLSATIRPGRLTMISGPNGSGKSTTLAAIMGLIAPDDGTVLIGSVPVAEIAPESLYEQVAWLPQQPVVIPGTVAENLALFGPLDGLPAPPSEPVPASSEPSRLIRASEATGFATVIADLERAGRGNGLDIPLGAGGVGLSAGQRQRLALTRVLASSAPLLLLDEPTAHLDAASERRVLQALAARAHAGDTVVLVGHRDVIAEYADDVVHLGASTDAAQADPGRRANHGG